MKKFDKLSRDTRPQEQPEGTYPFAKNGVQDYIRGVVINEPGFLPSSAVIPYSPLGVIETDGFPIILSGNNVNSAIGYFDVEADVYTPILDDASLSFKMNFDTNFYITGQSQRNYKGEMVIAFTDKNQFPFYINCDNPNANTLNDIKLFPNALPADIDVVVETGGILFPGAYYVALKYTKTDGTETGYLSVSAPRPVIGTTGIATDKCLEITLTHLDPDFDNVQIAIVSKINGILSAVQFVNPVKAEEGAVLVYTGTEITEAVTLEEILTPRKVYNRVGTMGQLNDSLYVADLESPLQVRMQPWVNLIRLRWHSKLITVAPVYEPMSAGREKSFMHQEVYCAYIRFKKTDGTNTSSFVLIGEALTSDNRATSSVATAEGITAPKFQVEDTIPSFDAATKSGYFGKWENESEFYPNTDDFNSTSYGGEDLRGQKVRHHRFPSVHWCKQNLYSGDTSYGKNALDMLGISVENVVIPSQFSAEIIGWEIFFAKRNVANSTVIGQSAVIFGGRNKYETELHPTNYYSSGGNWNSVINYKSEHFPIYLDQSIFHFYSFDMLLGKPSVTPDYMALQLKLQRNDLMATGALIEDGAVHNGNDGPITLNIDYLERGISPTLPAKLIKGVKDTQNVPNNIELGNKWHNLQIEAYFGGIFSHPELLIDPGTIGLVDVQPSSRQGYTPQDKLPSTEITFLANMMSVKQQLFVPFTAQSLVRAASSNTLDNPTIFFGGDTYICDYTFHTYGWWTSTNAGEPYQGTKVARRIVCECAANLYARFEDPLNNYSRYYPKSSMVQSDAENYLTNFLRVNDPNQFGYRKDSNALDDLFSADVFNTFTEDIHVHPYRIARGGKMSRQTKIRNWRTFLPLDYYEAQKNMGRIINLEGMDDRLIIHHENAMFLTQDKTKLESDIIAVTLGSGDIFQFAPQEGMSAKLGYAGTQHDLACIRSPFGYHFIDSIEGNLFTYKGQLELINDELNTFFKEFLRIREKNPYTGNGYTLGYDPQYKRLLLTVKNSKLSEGPVTLPTYDPANIDSYTAGDKMLKDGRIVEFLGPNETIYDCTPDITVVANDLTLTIPENTPVGTIIGTLTGTAIDYYILALSPFSVNPNTGEVRVAAALDYYVQNSYTIDGQGYHDGINDSFVLTVNLTVVNRAPVVKDVEVTIGDDAVNADAVATVVATDREGGSLTYSIVSGNTSGAFTINAATGAITVADATQLNGVTNPTYNIVVSVSDGTLSTTGQVIVHIAHENHAPTAQDITVDILDTTADGATILTLGDTEVDPEGDPLTYQFLSASVSGVFTFDPATLKIKLVANSSLTPATIPGYTLFFTVTDGLYGHAPVPFTVTVGVKYDRASLEFVPAVASCTSGSPSCGTGYTLSGDGSVCVKRTNVAPTITSSGCLAASPYVDYGAYFARIYKPGFHSSSIALYTAPSSEVYAEMPTTYWKGVPNSIAVWADTNCDGTKDALSPGTQTTVSYTFNNTTASRTVYVGVFGDNEFELKVNGASIALTPVGSLAVENFKILHIFPVTIINGNNIFNVVGTDNGGVSAVGMIVYDNLPATIQAATTNGALTILFSTQSMIGQPNNVSTCPAGYVLDTTGAPTCIKVETQVPTSGLNVRHWEKIQIMDTRLSQLITTVNNEVTSPISLFQDIPIPFYPDVTNHVGCGGTVTSYLSALKRMSAQKADCTNGTGSVVEYASPAGYHMSLVSQPDADAMALADVISNKQSYANYKGTCS